MIELDVPPTSSPVKREKKGAHPAKQDGIDEGTSTSFPLTSPIALRLGPFLSRVAAIVCTYLFEFHFPPNLFANPKNALPSR
jgi:hypothetical protein